jgi:uncharacterized RDD family membrane protein YckC
MSVAGSIRREAMAVDTTVRLVTPERVSFRYALAGPFRRAVAYLADMVIWAILVVAIFLSLMFLLDFSPSGQGVALVAFFVLQWGYGMFCEVVFNGRTPGKKLAGLRVVSENGVPISAGQAVLRNLVLPIDGWPLCFLPALASMALTSKFQRLGDLAAGTMVVVEEAPRLGKLVRPDDPESKAVLELLPLKIDAGQELSQALADYVKRRHRFPPARREELARDLAAPLARRYGLPMKISADAILCAVYLRVFMGG